MFDKIEKLVDLLDNKDEYTENHSRQVMDNVSDAVKKDGFSEEERERIKEAALIHDIGRVNKEGKELQEFVLNRNLWEKPEEINRINSETIPFFLLQLGKGAISNQHFCEWSNREMYLKLGFTNEMINEIVYCDRYNLLTRKTRYRDALTCEAASRISRMKILT